MAPHELAPLHLVALRPARGRTSPYRNENHSDPTKRRSRALFVIHDEDILLRLGSACNLFLHRRLELPKSLMIFLDATFRETIPSAFGFRPFVSHSHPLSLVTYFLTICQSARSDKPFHITSVLQCHTAMRRTSSRQRLHVLRQPPVSLRPMQRDMTPPADRPQVCELVGRAAVLECSYMVRLESARPGRTD